MGDERKHTRDEVEEPAFISFEGNSISCVVCNISLGGAAIDVPDPSEIPGKFILLIQSDRRTFVCRIIWINNNRIGVSFTS
jgi:hypothetical protein